MSSSRRNAIAPHAADHTRGLQRRGHRSGSGLVRRVGSGIGLTALLAFPLSGCGTADEPGTDAGEPAASSALTLTESVEYLGSVAVREPMVVEHPDGTLFVSGYTQDPARSLDPPNLFMSRDGGASWEPVDVTTGGQSVVGNSDVDLTIGPDGTIYFLTMGFDRSVGEGTHVAVGVSRDVGESWEWTFESRDRLDDRPWISVAPDGAVRLIWNDGEGVRFVVSDDDGRTWTERPRIHDQGHSSHLAVGPAGEIAVRITPLSASGNRFHEGVDFLAVSQDGGATWQQRPVPGTREWTEAIAAPGAVPRWVEPIAWDADGALYSLWSEGNQLWLGQSTDRGESWGWGVVASGDEMLFYPYLTARGSGELAATWFSGTGDDLRANVALIDMSGTEAPRMRTLDPFPIDSWSLRGDPPTRDAGGEYIPVIFLADGDLGVVTPIQNMPEERTGFTWHRVSPQED